MANDNDNSGGLFLLFLFGLLAWFSGVFGSDKKKKQPDIDTFLKAKPKNKEKAEETSEDKEGVAPIVLADEAPVPNYQGLNDQTNTTNAVSAPEPLSSNANINKDLKKIAITNLMLDSKKYTPVTSMYKKAPLNFRLIGVPNSITSANSSIATAMAEDEKKEEIAGLTRYKKEDLLNANINSLINNLASDIATKNNKSVNEVKEELLNYSGEAIIILNKYNENLIKSENLQNKKQFPIESLITKSFLEEVYSLKNVIAAFEIARYDFDVGGDKTLAEVVISAKAQEFNIDRGKLGKSGLTIEEVKQGLAEELDKKKESGAMKTTADEFEVTQDYLKEHGVREDVKLNKTTRQVLNLKSDKLSVTELNNLTKPLIRSTNISRGNTENGITIYPSNLPDNKGNISPDFDVAHKIFITTFMQAKDYFVEDFFIDKNDGKGKVLNVDEQGNFHFNPSKYNVDPASFLDEKELKEFRKNKDLTIPFKQGFFNYNDFTVWKQQISKLDTSDLKSEFADFQIKLDSVASKFEDGSYVQIKEFGRNFEKVNNLYNSQDKTEKVPKYKEDYAKSIINSLQQDILQKGSKADNEAVEEYIDKKIKEMQVAVQTLSSYSPKGNDRNELLQAKEILLLTAKEQILQNHLEYDILKIAEEYNERIKKTTDEKEKSDLRYEKDQKKIALTLEYVAADNINDIKLFDLKNYESIDKINKLIAVSEGLPEVSKAIDVIMQDVDKEKLFGEAPWVSEGIKADKYIYRENLSAKSSPPDSDPMMRAVSKIGISAGGFEDPVNSELGASAAIKANITAVDYPFKDKDFRVESKANMEMRFLTKGKSFGYEKDNVLSLPFSSKKLDPTIIEKGDFDFIYKVNRFNDISTKLDFSANMAQEKQSGIISYDKIGLYGNKTSVGLKAQNNNLQNNNLKALGISFSNNWQVLGTGNTKNISAGIDVSTAYLNFENSNPDMKNKLLLEPKLSYTYSADGNNKFVNVTVTGQILSGFNDPYDQNNLSVIFIAKIPKWKTSNTFILSNQFKMLFSSLSYKYSLFDISTETGLKMALFNPANLNWEKQFGIYQEFNLGKTLLNLGVSMPGENNQFLKTPTFIETGFSLKRNF